MQLVIGFIRPCNRSWGWGQPVQAVDIFGQTKRQPLRRKGNMELATKKGFRKFRRREYLYLYLYLSIYPSIHPSIHLSIYLYTYIHIVDIRWLTIYVYTYILYPGIFFHIVPYMVNFSLISSGWFVHKPTMHPWPGQRRTRPAGNPDAARGNGLKDPWRQRMGWCWVNSGYPLVNLQKAIENGHL